MDFQPHEASDGVAPESDGSDLGGNSESVLWQAKELVTPDGQGSRNVIVLSQDVWGQFFPSNTELTSGKTKGKRFSSSISKILFFWRDSFHPTQNSVAEILLFHRLEA